MYTTCIRALCLKLPSFNRSQACYFSTSRGFVLGDHRNPLPKFRGHRRIKKGRVLLECWSFNEERSFASALRLQRIHSSGLDQATTMGSLNPSSVPVEVTLRKFTLADLKLSLKWFGDDEVTVTTPNDTIRSEEELERYFAATIANHPWYRLICVNGVPAGAIYLTMGAGAHAVRGDLSYILAKEHWGKGVVTEATKMALEAGFKEFHLARIQAYTLTTNIGSQRVLEKCGFQREGLLRNFVKLRGTVIVNVFVYGIYQDADMISD